MRKLFIHHPLFRLLSPVLSGIVVYLLILLLNNNVQQLHEEFFGEELYICIGLSYLIQEFSRLLLVLFKKLPQVASTFWQFALQIIISLVLCVVLVTTSITLYFKYILGFEATKEEIYTFNSIFCVITFIYILLYISHQYLYKTNTEKLNQEQLIKQNIEDDFKQFKKGINPYLLFESLETLVVLIKNDKDKSDDFIDHLATVYRYILSGKERQLVSFSEEYKTTEELIQLFNYLPYRSISIKNNIENLFLTVPGSLLFLIEQIVRSTIISSDIELQLEINESDNFVEISYNPNDKITTKFSQKDIKEIERVFGIYSKQKITIEEQSSTRIIRIPKLQIQPN